MCEFETNILLGVASLRGVLLKAMDCGIIVSEFELQSRYYVHFWTNTLGKGVYPLIILAEYQQYCTSRIMALALNILQRLICH